MFFAGCGFRCPFCHNASLVTQIDPAARQAGPRGAGFSRGQKRAVGRRVHQRGRALLQPEIEPFIKEIKAMGYSVKLDTNGQQFSQLVRLADQGLIDYVAMDIKNALPKYGKTIACPASIPKWWKKARSGCLTAPCPMNSAPPWCASCTKSRIFTKSAAGCGGAKRYYLQSFIDSGDTSPKGLSAYTKEELEHLRQVLGRIYPPAQPCGR